MGEGGFFKSKTKGVSQFWQTLHKVKNLFKWGAVFKVRNENHCNFWEDCWTGEVPVAVSHAHLFRMVRDPGCSVSDCWDEGEWVMDFRRSLTTEEYNNWVDLTNSLRGFCLETQESDMVSWALEPKGQYSTKSLYRFQTDRGMPSRVAGVIWKCKIPLKVKICLWQVFHNKPQVAGNLIKRGWKGDIK